MATILEMIFGYRTPTSTARVPAPTSIDWAAKSADEIVDEMLQLVRDLPPAPSPSRFNLQILAPVRRTRPGAWVIRGRRFRTWRLAFAWAVAHRLVVATRLKNSPDMLSFGYLKN